MGKERTAVERLGAALYDGPVRAVDLKVTRGTDPTRGAEELAAALYASMERAGLIRDGFLVRIEEACR